MSKQKPRNLTYQPPEAPSFLRSLKAQVSSGTRHSSSNKKVSDTDDFDSLLGVSSSQSAGATGQAQDYDDEDDDLAGAQIVVLKDGKHLTKEQAQDARKQQLLDSSSSTTLSDAKQPSQIAQAGSAPTARRKRVAIDSSHDHDIESPSSTLITTLLESDSNQHKRQKQSSGSNLEDVKELLRNEKEKKDAAKINKEKEKSKKLHEKNKLAKAEKKKSGKGLSFSFDDE